MSVGAAIISCSTALTLLVGCTVPIFGTEAGHDKAQVTILYDAFGKDSAMNCVSYRGQSKLPREW